MEDLKKEAEIILRTSVPHAQVLSSTSERIIIEFAVVFVQHLIDKGVLVEADNWISIKDRLPDNRKYVLSFSPNYNNIAEFKHGCFFDGLERLYNVTHWMPLPPTPGESPVSSAGKEMKTLQEDEIKMMTKQYRQSVESHAGATGFYAGAMKTKRWYDDQFKSSTASTNKPAEKLEQLKTVSDEEIEKRYPITGHEGIIVKNLMKGQRSAAKWMRKQLTGK